MSELYIPPVQNKDDEKMTPFSFATMIIGCSVTFYFQWTFTGPIEWAAAFQLDNYGVYYETWTFVGVAIALSGVVWLVGFGLCKVLGVDLDEPADQGEPSAIGKKIQAYRSLPGGLRWLLLIAVTTTVFGGTSVIDVMTNGELTTVDLATLERGEMPTSNYIEIKGTPLGDQSVGWGEGDDDSRYTYYTPLVSDLWKESMGLKVFISGRLRDIQDVSPHRAVRGRLRETTMPRYILKTFERAGITPAETHVYVQCNYDPARTEQSTFIILIIAAGTGLATGIWFAIRKRKRPTGA